MTDRGEDSGIEALRRALGYLRSYRRESIGMFVSLLLVSGANLAAPLLIGRPSTMGSRLGIPPLSS